jgi:hypothetical protein
LGIEAAARARRHDRALRHRLKRGPQRAHPIRRFDFTLVKKGRGTQLGDYDSPVLDGHDSLVYLLTATVRALSTNVIPTGQAKPKPARNTLETTEVLHCAMVAATARNRGRLFLRG